MFLPSLDIYFFSAVISSNVLLLLSVTLVDGVGHFAGDSPHFKSYDARFLLSRSCIVVVFALFLRAFDALCHVSLLSVETFTAAFYVSLVFHFPMYFLYPFSVLSRLSFHRFLYLIYYFFLLMSLLCCFWYFLKGFFI